MVLCWMTVSPFMPNQAVGIKKRNTDSTSSKGRRMWYLTLSLVTILCLFLLYVPERPIRCRHPATNRKFNTFISIGKAVLQSMILKKVLQHQKKYLSLHPQIRESWSVRISVSTQDFHSCKMSSTLIPTTKLKRINNGKSRIRRKAHPSDREAQFA